MSDVRDALRQAYEADGYAVDSVADNRGRLRVALREDGPDAEALRQIARDVCGADAVVGLDVSTETSAGDDAVLTVVSFRHRP
jgi:uncharacterized protein YbjQ (UPF0145 family)